MSSANIGSDHGLVLSKLRKNKPPEHTQKTNFEPLESESARIHCRTRLEQNIEDNNINVDQNIEKSWNKIAQNILEASAEALGTRKVDISNQRIKTLWFT